jgi:hypothetical protein
VAERTTSSARTQRVSRRITGTSRLSASRWAPTNLTPSAT